MDRLVTHNTSGSLCPLITEMEKRQGGFPGSFRINGIILLEAAPGSTSGTGLEYNCVGHFFILDKALAMFDSLEEYSDQDIITIT